MTEGRMPIEDQPAMDWVLSADRRTVRMQLPPLPIASLPEPLNVFVDFDAEMVDEILQRLSEVRTRMLPAPLRQ
jgi:hypothetical protein